MQRFQTRYLSSRPCRPKTSITLVRGELLGPVRGIEREGVRGNSALCDLSSAFSSRRHGPHHSPPRHQLPPAAHRAQKPGEEAHCEPILGKGSPLPSCDFYFEGSPEQKCLHNEPKGIAEMGAARRTGRVKTRAETQARNRSIYELHRAGVSDKEIAEQTQLPLPYVRRIRRTEERRETLPPLEARLPSRTLNALAKHFGWQTLQDPKRLAERITQEKLLLYSGIGVRGAAHIVREMARLGCPLRSRRPVRFEREDKPVIPRAKRAYARARNRLIYEDYKRGLPYHTIAEQWGLRVRYVRRICGELRERESWPPLRASLSTRAQNALLRRFNGDTTIFTTPAYIVEETEQRQLYADYVGRKTVTEIAEVLAGFGFVLRDCWRPRSWG